jgi:hypothetical protein
MLRMHRLRLLQSMLVLGVGFALLGVFTSFDSGYRAAYGATIPGAFGHPTEVAACDGEPMAATEKPQ